jgi:hypothetical protein
MLVTMKRISTVLGLLAGLTAATSLASPPTRNQQTAESVAASLRSSAELASSPIRIETREGLVTLTGTVSNPALKAEAVARARATAGVTAVVDQLRLVGDDNRVLPVIFRHGAPMATTMDGAAAAAPYGAGAPGAGAPNGASAPMAGAMGDGGPLPEGPAIPGANQAAQPGYPNYAWPSYAPFPNYSAVGYPTAYPWQAWPNIGPFYPYPEVPLDWRAVTLRWDDGIWWLDFRKHYTRPFFTPYPFGIFGY